MAINWERVPQQEGRWRSTGMAAYWGREM
jgi:hypothetical protein